MNNAPAQHDQSWSEFLQRLDAPTPSYPLAISGLDQEQLELYKQSQKLLKAWQRFIQKLPPDQRPDPTARPDLTTVRSAIQKSYEKREARKQDTMFGKTNAMLGTFLDHCNDYSYLLALIPNGDKYVSVITGSVSAIAHAYINDNTIGSAVIEALGSVDVEVEFWKRRIKNHQDNSIMRQYITQLFVYMFELYTDVFTKWSASGWDRFKRSFNKNFIKETIDPKVASMRSLAKRLSDEADFTQENLLVNMNATLNNIPQQLDDLARKLDQLGNGNVQIIISTTSPVSTTQTSAFSSLNHPTSQASLPSVSHSNKPTPPKEVQLINDKKAVLTPYYENETITSLCPKMPPMFLSSSTTTALRTWCTNPKSEMVWTEDSFDAELPSKATQVAAAINHLALSQPGNLPVVSFSCNSPHFRGHSTDSKLARMLCAIITQICQHVSIDDLIIADPDFTDDFLALDHTSSDTTSPLSILTRLLDRKPPFMFLLIDGLQNVDRHRDFDKLVEIFSSVVEKGGDDVLKILLSSNGHVMSLSRTISRGVLRHVALRSTETAGGGNDSDEDLENEF